MKEKNIIMPDLKENAKTAVLCSWLKDEGETVKKGEPIFEVEIDKVVMQVEADSDGVIKKILADEGDEVEINAPVAVIEE